MDYLKVSIVTPNYNYAHFIDKLIESVLQQDYPAIEHIIVDDGSTDNSVNIVNHYIEKHPNRIRLIRQVNQGQTTAINVGLRAAKGDLIGWINSDDTYCAGSIKSIVSCFLKNPSIDIVFGDYCLTNENSEILKMIKQLNIDYSMGACIGFGLLVSSNSVFWKASLMQKVGFLNEDLIYNMDGEYWSRLFYEGKSKHISTYIANFRWHAAAKTVRNQNKNMSERYKFELKYEINKSYSHLWISRFIPFKHSKMLRKLYRFKRVFQRFIRWHYFSGKVMK